MISWRKARRRWTCTPLRRATVVTQVSGVPRRQRTASERGGRDGCGVGAGRAGIPRIPEVTSGSRYSSKVMDMPALEGDFYLNLLD